MKVRGQVRLSTPHMQPFTHTHPLIQSLSFSFFLQLHTHKRSALVGKGRVRSELRPMNVKDSTCDRVFTLVAFCAASYISCGLQTRAVSRRQGQELRASGRSTAGGQPAGG